MSATIQVRVDDELKVKSDELFRALGTDTKYLSEDEIFSKLEISRQHAYEGMVKDADCMVAEMRTKYGL